MTITPPGSIAAIAGETITLECSTDITPSLEPDSLYENATTPNFGWFYDSNNSSTANVTVTVVKNDSTYTSTLHFSPLLLSHTGLYICRFGGNRANTTITVLSCKCNNILSLGIHVDS